MSISEFLKLIIIGSLFREKGEGPCFFRKGFKKSVKTGIKLDINRIKIRVISIYYIDGGAIPSFLSQIKKIISQ